MRIQEITTDDQFHQMRHSWENLLNSSGSNSVFVTWEWLTAWWSAYGERGSLQVLAAFDDNNILRGIAPLRRKVIRKFGQSVPVVAFVGDGSYDSDYLDFVIASGWESGVLDAVRRHLQNSGDPLMWLNEIPDTSPNLPVLKAAGERLRMLYQENSFPCGVVLLPPDFDQYLATMRSRFRTKVRAVLRNLEGNPDVEFGFCQDSCDVDQLLPILFDLHTRRWSASGQPGVFGTAEKRRFYEIMSRRFIERGWLRLSWLKWKGQVLACQFGFVYGDKYYLLQEGYEPASEHWNPGVGLRAWTIRQLIHQGVSEYDFLAGSIRRHRSDWGAVQKDSKQIRLGPPNYRNLLVCKGPAWRDQVKEYAKRFIPEGALALRREKLTRTEAVPPATGMSLAEKATARCYWGLGMPTLIRPLRERYQLSLSGGRPRVSLSRRSEPSARILYYHRVRDKRDAFFPAIPTTVFEHEMEFISRHYQVVGLSELLNHLESGSNETVVAVTFDDGYRDNFENAFPIIRRYGIPATIFLSTGSLDFQSPLWFNVLAFAVKHTTQAFIDIEIDVPTRLNLETEAARIAAHGKLYDLLRPMPDIQRQEWMKHILRQLRYTGGAEEGDEMLSWDQVRLMRKNGVDFGGHTVTHPFISRLTSDRVEWELTECKRRIENELQSPVDHFAYPSGRPQDIGDWNKELVSRAGYKCAVSTVWGMNYASTDRMELRRGGPWEEHRAEFAYKLDWYQFVNG